MTSGKVLLIVDGMAALYRAFYGIRNLSTAAGVPTNAVFGFVRMMKQLKEKWNPSHWALVFDGGLPQERLERLETYKAQRPPMPGELKQQIPLAEEYLACARIRQVRLERQEADDAIASLAEWAKPEAEQVLIATSDKDIFQIVDDRRRIVPFSDKDPVLDADGVKAKTGVSPAQIVDWLALVGDTADNIPGVPGVGPKTAARLLEAYRDWDGIWAHVSAIESEKTRKALVENRDLVLRNVALIRLRRDLECSVGWEALEVKAPDTGGLLALYEKLEFRSMARELQEGDLFA